jgi:hypothetical protein
MGHVLSDQDIIYMKEKGVTYLDNLPDDTLFKMSAVQFYFEGPYDFDSTFRKVNYDNAEIQVEQLVEGGEPNKMVLPPQVQVYKV